MFLIGDYHTKPRGKCLTGIVCTHHLTLSYSPNRTPSTRVCECLPLGLRLPHVSNLPK